MTKPERSTKPRARRGWGRVAKLPSGRYRASYLHQMTLFTPSPAGTTFASKIDAEGWLADERRKIDRGTWTPPGTEDQRSITLAEYAERRISQRTLTPRTRKGYEETLANHIVPVLGSVALSHLSVTMVRAWYSNLLLDKPTARAHAYGLLHSICRDALRENLITANPCVEQRAMVAKRTRKIRALTVAQLTAVAENTPDELRAAVLIGGWCGLRPGELKGLRRRDITEDASVVSIKRAVTYRSGVYYLGPPKTEAGIRDVQVPKRIRPVILAHLQQYTATGADSLVFVGAGGPEGYLTDWTLRRAVGAAGDAAGIEDLRPHELRHTAATLAAQTGATTKQLMSRIGHATVDAALIYQHAAAELDAEIARKLDEM